MTSPGSTGLTVDLLLSGYRVVGVSYQANERDRLTDVLNGRSDTMGLRHASILGMNGQVMASLPQVSIEKRHILAAIPEETDDYQQMQRVYRIGMAKPALVRVPVLAVLPPYACTGKVHVPPGSDISDPEHSGLARFFPLTDAVVFMGEDRVFQGQIALINREVVAVLGRTGDEIRARPLISAAVQGVSAANSGPL